MVIVRGTRKAIKHRYMMKMTGTSLADCHLLFVLGRFSIALLLRVLVEVRLLTTGRRRRRFLHNRLLVLRLDGRSGLGRFALRLCLLLARNFRQLGSLPCQLRLLSLLGQLLQFVESVELLLALSVLLLGDTLLLLQRLLCGLGLLGRKTSLFGGYALHFGNAGGFLGGGTLLFNDTSLLRCGRSSDTGSLGLSCGSGSSGCDSSGFGSSLGLGGLTGLLLLFSSYTLLLGFALQFGGPFGGCLSGKRLLTLELGQARLLCQFGLFGLLLGLLQQGPVLDVMTHFSKYSTTFRQIFTHFSSCSLTASRRCAFFFSRATSSAAPKVPRRPRRAACFSLISTFGSSSGLASVNLRDARCGSSLAAGRKTDCVMHARSLAIVMRLR